MTTPSVSDWILLFLVFILLAGIVAMGLNVSKNVRRIQLLEQELSVRQAPSEAIPAAVQALPADPNFAIDEIQLVGIGQPCPPADHIWSTTTVRAMDVTENPEVRGRVDAIDYCARCGFRRIRRVA